MIIPAGTKELTDYGITLTAAQINDAELQANKGQPNGYAPLNADGDLVGPLILADVTTEVLADNAIALRGGKMVVGDGSTAGGVYLPVGLPMTDDSYIIPERGATDAESYANVVAALTAAAALTPGGNALSATNRARVWVLPGGYDLGSPLMGEFSLDFTGSNYVDLIGLSPNASDVLFYGHTGGSQLMLVTGNTIVANLRLHGISDDPAGTILGSDAPTENVTLRNVLITGEDGMGEGLPNAGISSGFGGTLDRVTTTLGSFVGPLFTGTAIDCVAGKKSFGQTSGTSTGTLIRCEASGDRGGDPIGGVFTGLARGCRFVMTGTNQHAFRIGAGARLYDCEFIATGTGTSIYADSAVTAEIANCHTPQGIGANVTNSLLSEAISWSVSVSGTLATGDDQAYFIVPSKLNGMRLRRVRAVVKTAGTTGTTDIQIANVTGSVDLLSTKLTIDSGETSSATATAAVIDHDNSLLTTDDRWRIDIDAVSTTPPEYLDVILEAY